MAAKATRVLTSIQKKALKDTAANLDKAYAARRRALSAAGIPNDNGSTKCLAPPGNHCKAFMPPVRGSRCARPGCGHVLTKHDIF